MLCHCLPAWSTQPACYASRYEEPYNTLLCNAVDDRSTALLQFSEWLRLQRGQLFNDLTSEQARSQFVDFIEAWNSRNLPARYYKGVTGTTLRRTKHAWAIKGA